MEGSAPVCPSSLVAGAHAERETADSSIGANRRPATRWRIEENGNTEIGQPLPRLNFT